MDNRIRTSNKRSTILNSSSSSNSSSSGSCSSRSINSSCRSKNSCNSTRALLLFFIVGLSYCCCIPGAQGSAIPMWEFLTRDEKISHLYRIFSQEVTRFCADSTMPDCNKNLLVRGIRTLANMDDDKLDQFDPYQRGAQEMIWKAMIGDSRIYSVSRLDHQVNDDAEDHLSFGDSNELRSPSADESRINEDYLTPESSGRYLMGPMVIRVYPDGRPVPSSLTNSPYSSLSSQQNKDEDIDDIKVGVKSPELILKDIEQEAASNGNDLDKKNEYKKSNNEQNQQVQSNSKAPMNSAFQVPKAYQQIFMGARKYPSLAGRTMTVLFKRSPIHHSVVPFYLAPRPMFQANPMFLRERRFF